MHHCPQVSKANGWAEQRETHQVVGASPWALQAQPPGGKKQQLIARQGTKHIRRDMSLLHS